jgi:hypothetical protein
MNTPFSYFAAPAFAARQNRKKEIGFWDIYPGWQSLRSLTLGYYDLALSGL